MHPLRETLRSLRSSPVFAFYVLLTLGLAGLNGLMVALMALRLEDLLPGPFAQMTHFTEPIHRVHDLSFGFLFVSAIAGMLAQLRRPSKNVSGILMALMPFAGLLLAAFLSADVLRVILFNPSPLVGVAAIFTALLHPTGRSFFRSFSVSRMNWVMLGLIIVGAMPLLVFASTNIGLQGTLDEHAGMGHYGFMAALAFTIIGTGVLASLRADGWRLTAWVAGILPALLGMSSVVYPDATSSLDLVWAVAAMAWGAVFILTAELTKDADGPDVSRFPGRFTRSAPSRDVMTEGLSKQAIKPTGAES